MKRIGILLAVGVVAIPAMAIAQTSQLPEHAAARVAEAHAQAVAVAQEMASENARGLDENKTTGLARAAEVSKSWRFTGVDRPGYGNGRALGTRRADAVHEALAAGKSPSSLGSHGESVSAAAHEMVEAFAGMKAKSEDEAD